MEGRVTIFPLSLFSRRIFLLSFSHVPSISSTRVVLFLSRFFQRPTFTGSLFSFFKRGHVQPRWDVFRIRGSSTRSSSFSFSEGRTTERTAAHRERVENDLDDNFISSYCQHVSAIRLSLPCIEKGCSMFHTLPRKYINLRRGNRTVDIFVDNASCHFGEKIWRYPNNFPNVVCVHCAFTAWVSIKLSL